MFKTALRGLGTGFYIASPDNLSGMITGGSPAYNIAGDHYTIRMGEYQDQLHPDLGPTTLWGYFPERHTHLAGLILAKKGRPVQLTMINQLPETHIIPIDTSSFFLDANTIVNKTAVHLHGGFVPWISDGGPQDWFAPDGAGPSFLNNKILKPGPNLIWGSLQAGQAEYFYPNDQSARLMWYHDHAHDLTRLNAYAGLASGYVLYDDFELGLIKKTLLPPLDFQIPIIVQDKIFVNEDVLAKDPAWRGLTTPGSLWYPHTYEVNSDPPPSMTPPFIDQASGTSGSGRWDAVPGLDLPDPSCIPEMFGDTMLVNGTVYPTVVIQAKRNRFRILNACNARFLNLQLYRREGNSGIHLAPIPHELDPNGNPVLVPNNQLGPVMYQIGAEGGFLPTIAALNTSKKPCGWLSTGPASTIGNVNRYNLLLGNAERADVIIDFANCEGNHYLLYNDAPGPFPGGDVRNDYYWGMPDTRPIGGIRGPARQLEGPNTRILMEIVVVKATTPDTIPTSIWLQMMNLQLALHSLTELAPLPLPGTYRRVVTLNESFDAWGRLVQNLGSNVADSSGYFGKAYEGTIEASEVIQAGKTEIWEIFNLTGDTHPIHFHLVNVRVINRQPYDPIAYSNNPSTPVFLGPSTGPDLNERGWKETVRMNPGEVTRVIMKFDLPKVPFAQQSSPYVQSKISGGAQPPVGKIYHEYVVHCHILEHEEHDMMRPLVVVGPAQIF